MPVAAVLSPVFGTEKFRNASWAFIGLLFTVIIGFRFQVGSDWSGYLNLYRDYSIAPLAEVLAAPDPGYVFLNWISAQLGGGIYLVNAVCAAIFITGLISFCRRQPQPWLALSIAVPYLIIVVALTYTRQSVAIGFELLALTALADGRLRKFIILTVIGALFHKSAILLFPLTLLVRTDRPIWTLVWVSITAVLFGIVLLLEYYEVLLGTYIEGGLSSEGGFIRVALNALAGTMVLLFRNKLALTDNERRIWVGIAIVSLACVPLVGIASTAVDRIALYFLPIQLLVFSRLHMIFADRLLRTITIVSIFAAYGVVEYVWLNYAISAFQTVPYRIFL